MRRPAGSQMRSISRGGISKAVSMTAGATNKASARVGSMLKCGAKGNTATQPPISASMAGYGTRRRRAHCSSTTAIASRTRVISNNCMGFSTFVPSADSAGRGLLAQQEAALLDATVGDRV
jgi:hypothetical protein